MLRKRALRLVSRDGSLVPTTNTHAPAARVDGLVFDPASLAAP